MEVGPIGEARDLSLFMLSPSHHHSLTLPGWPLSTPPLNSCSEVWVLSSTKLPKKKPFLNIFFDHICVVQSVRSSHSRFPYPCSKCCLSFGLTLSGIAKQYFIVWGNLFWPTAEMLGEIQHLSLASFCLSHWVSLTTYSSPFPSAGMSHSPGPSEPHCQGTKTGSHYEIASRQLFHNLPSELWKLPSSQLPLRISPSSS